MVRHSDYAPNYKLAPIKGQPEMEHNCHKINQFFCFFFVFFFSKVNHLIYSSAPISPSTNSNTYYYKIFSETRNVCL